MRACSATGWLQSFPSAAVFATTGECARNSRPSRHARGALFLGRRRRSAFLCSRHERRPWQSAAMRSTCCAPHADKWPADRDVMLKRAMLRKVGCNAAVRRTGSCARLHGTRPMHRCMQCHEIQDEGRKCRRGATQALRSNWRCDKGGPQLRRN